MLSRLSGAVSICCALLAAAPGTAGAESAPPVGVITDVRHGRHDGFTRVVIETSRAVDAPVERLPADPGARRPERLYLDLENIRLEPQRRRSLGVRDDRVQRIRVGAQSPRRTRVVIDLAASGRYQQMRLSDPHRIVIDVYDDAEPVHVALAPEAAEQAAQAPPAVTPRPDHSIAPEPALPSPPPSALGGNVDTSLEVTTTVTLESAVGTRHGHFQKSVLAFEPEIEMELPWQLDLTGTGRVRFDAFDRLDPGTPDQPEVSRLSRRGHIGNRGEYELRELYLERELGDLFVRAGKQHIVWGKADGLKVLDLVNPQDFGEFVLEDFEDSRIPLWALNAELPIGDVTAQAVWILDQSYHDLPEADALYSLDLSALVPPNLASLIVLEVEEVRRPRRVFRDSDAGLRLSTFFRGWDLTLNYLRLYEDLPVLARTAELVPGRGIVVTVTPRYERTDLVGGTFSNAFGEFTVRGELGYSFRKEFTTLSLADLDGVARSDELSYVLGLDWFGLSETFLSVQLFQSFVRDHQPGFLDEDRDTTWSLVARRDFLNDTLELQLLWVHNRNVGDGFVRPKILYDLSDNVRTWVGADIFYGSELGLFGRFDELDRIVLGVEWTR